MPPIAVPASFWRGGTSRGLLVRAERLAAYPARVRDGILKAALGSPDPAGRQISGLGGGVSSLSKVAIVSAPGEARQLQQEWGPLPGVPWADDGTRHGREWDVVYRFGQVPVKTDDPIDWTASCGNMVAAAALSALSTSIVPYSKVFLRAKALPRSDDVDPFAPVSFPISLLSASNGVVMRAHVPIDPVSLQVYEPARGRGVEIAGVPGRDEPGIEVEMPLDFDASPGGTEAKGGLVTGRATDVVSLPDDDGATVTVSILTSGLPNVFLPVSSLLAIPSASHLPANLLTLSTQALTAIPDLSTLLEQIRTTAARHFSIPLSLASPKIALVGPVPHEGYVTSAGQRVEKVDADVLVRAVSSGDWHATVPGTTLGALNVGAGIEGTVVHDLVHSRTTARTDAATLDRTRAGRKVSIRAAHLAGVAESTVRFDDVDGSVAESVVMVRTAREIMRGEVLVPEHVFFPSHPLDPP
ncbi:hypothetical protein JCM10212_005592 [Sporobolomyces blumeae]